MLSSFQEMKIHYMQSKTTMLQIITPALSWSIRQVQSASEDSTSPGVMFPISAFLQAIIT